MQRSAHDWPTKWSDNIAIRRSSGQDSRHEQLQEIEAILEDMIKENARKQTGEMADRRFHVAIARATRNSAITTVVENLGHAL